MRYRIPEDRGIPLEVIILSGDGFASPTKLPHSRTSKWEGFFSQKPKITDNKSCHTHAHKREQPVRIGAQYNKALIHYHNKTRKISQLKSQSNLDEPISDNSNSVSSSNSIFESTDDMWNPIQLMDWKPSNCKETTKEGSGLGFEQWYQYREDEEIRLEQSNNVNVESEHEDRIENIQLERQFQPLEWDIISDDSLSYSQSIFENRQVDSPRNSSALPNLKTSIVESRLEPAQLHLNHVDTQGQQIHNGTKNSEKKIECQLRNEIENTHLGKQFQPGPWDVICRRGRQPCKHIGNQKFRVLLAIHIPNYIEARCRNDKSEVIDLIVNTIRDASPCGGFVKQDAKGVWYKLGPTLAREKVSHALRDWTVEHRRKGNCSAVERKAIIVEAQNTLLKACKIVK